MSALCHQLDDVHLLDLVDFENILEELFGCFWGGKILVFDGNVALFHFFAVVEDRPRPGIVCEAMADLGFFPILIIIPVRLPADVVDAGSL